MNMTDRERELTALVGAMAEKIWLMATHLGRVAEMKLTPRKEPMDTTQQLLEALGTPPLDATMDEINQWALRRAFVQVTGEARAKQVAKMLGLSVKTVYNRCHEFGINSRTGLPVDASEQDRCQDLSPTWHQYHNGQGEPQTIATD